MRIGIDARLFGAKHRGIGRYTEELIRNLEMTDQINEYVIFLAPDGFEAYQPANPRFRKVSADFKVYGVFEQLLYPFLLYRYRLDVMHFTHFNAPLLYARKIIVTIHDLIISHYPTSRATTLNPLLYQLKLAAYRFLISAAARRAKKIIAVSNYTKNDIVKFLKVPPEKITVVYEGVDLPQESSGAENPAVKLGLSDDYIMYVGSAYPHKNLEMLIDVFSVISGERPSLQLLLVGKHDFFYDRLRAYAAKKLPPETAAKVVFAGYQSDKSVAALYQGAQFYVFPSLMEGFGLPPLEAQSCGLPVISSNRSCLPEILGESAAYFNPESEADMAEKILAVLSDENLRRDLIQRGYENVKKYSWRKMAEEIIKLYEVKF